MARISILVLALIILASAARADDSLYQAFGGEAGVTRLADGLVDTLLVDARVKDQFKDTNIKRLRRQFKSQFCTLMGGPCVYEGRSMEEAHRNRAIDEAGFNAVVEDLQDAMRAQGIAFATQNRLIALLAPMKRDIVTR